MIAAGELGLLAEVVATWPLGIDRLLDVRALLTDENRWPDLTPGLLVHRAVLLDAVCRALAAQGFAPIEHFASLGEAFPATPEDTSTLAAGRDG